MSKIIITGSAIVLKSALTLDTIRKLSKYRPAALKKLDDKEKVVFKIDIAYEGNGVVSDKGIFFAPVTHDEEGLATVTLNIPENVTCEREYVADLLGPAFTALNEMEEFLQGAANEVDEARNYMMEQITVQ